MYVNGKLTRTQIARAQEIKSHFIHNMARDGADARKLAEKAATGVIVDLGLVHEDN
jgi:NADH dehydrogenase (ubiquinone) Fe-S protein 5